MDYVKYFTVIYVSGENIDTKFLFGFFLPDKNPVTKKIYKESLSY